MKKSDEDSNKYHQILKPTINILFLGLGLVGIPLVCIAKSAQRVLEIESESSSTLLWIFFLGVLLLTLLSGLFTLAASAIDALRPSLKATPKQKDESLFENLIQDKINYVTSCTIGNQVSRTLLILLCIMPSPILARYINQIWGINPNWGLIFLCSIIISIPVMVFHLIFGELIPKSYAIIFPQKITRKLYGFITVTHFLFGIISNVVIATTKRLTRRFISQALYPSHPAEQEIKHLIESAQKTGEIKIDEKQLIQSVFEFDDTTAKQIMTPRVDMESVPVTAEPQEVINVIQSSGFSRIPVYEETEDQIVGIIHAKDLLIEMSTEPKPSSIRALLRPALFVPQNKNLHDLLQEMRATRTQMAIIQDEFGGTAGIVTIEDIVEELVGEIVDEYDIEAPRIVFDGKGYIVDGKLGLTDLNEAIGSDFTDEEFETVGGYVFGLFGRQPKTGDAIEDDDYSFTVTDSDGRRILKLYIVSLKENPTQSKTNEPPPT